MNMWIVHVCWLSYDFISLIIYETGAKQFTPTRTKNVKTSQRKSSCYYAGCKIKITRIDPENWQKKRKEKRAAGY